VQSQLRLRSGRFCVSRRSPKPNGCCCQLTRGGDERQGDEQGQLGVHVCSHIVCAERKKRSARRPRTGGRLLAQTGSAGRAHSENSESRLTLKGAALPNCLDSSFLPPNLQTKLAAKLRYSPAHFCQMLNLVNCGWVFEFAYLH